MYYGYNISEHTAALARQAEADCAEVFKKIEENALICSAKVLSAFQECRVSTADFIEITGYGYTDSGRDKLEEIYAKVFGAEDALVRPQLMSGTHALAVTLGGLLKHGDTLLYISGEPYDTLRSVIGTSGESRNSLIKCGVKYEEIDLIDREFDLEKIKERVSQGDVKVAAIQRSRGYSQRKSLTIDKIAEAIRVVKEASPNTVIMVDNCYGEFTEDREPTDVGADVFVGSMMKNLGAGFAVSGGYCVGRAEIIEDIAERLTAPCVGKSLGANFNQLASFYKGFFMAPAAVASTLKSMSFAARLLELAGFSDVSPRYDEKRTDIVQTMDLHSADKLIKFCKGIQMGSPVESYCIPEPGDMPGYPHPEIMAAGTFITGATNELSCDGPLCEPYTAYMQGGLTYEYGKLGVMRALDEMLDLHKDEESDLI
ncbi:MAG: methionine gamma-lyase family protein [Clostridia bacterium]|nr:methionine gamma-lyase family protein [Clostridia bacterium]